MTSAVISVELRDSIATIRLNRPEIDNALSREMLEDISRALTSLDNDPNVRVIIFTGAEDGAFSGVTDKRDSSGSNEDAATDASQVVQEICGQIENLGIPVIAVVNGIAARDGFELALACHLRVASANAEFTLPKPKTGMIPPYAGTERLARIIGSGRAAEAVLTGRTVTADEALRIGLVNRMADRDNLLREAESLANEIVKLAPLAIRACLEAVTKGRDLPLHEGLALEVELFSELFATGDVREGTQAFLEKRTPLFAGR